MKSIFVFVILLTSYAANAESKSTKNVNVPKCEQRIRQLAIAAHSAGMAWGELNGVRDYTKGSFAKELERRDATHEAFLQAQFNAISCLYEKE